MNASTTLQDKQALEILKKAKELLDKHLIGKQDFVAEIENIFEDMLATKNLDIRLYDGTYNYTFQYGKVLAGKERLSYAPVRIKANSSVAWFYFYENGNYDIDRDIEILEEILGERS